MSLLRIPRLEFSFKEYQSTDSFAKFKTNPGELFENKNICVTGKIEDYKGKLQIIVNSPDDIKIL